MSPQRGHQLKKPDAMSVVVVLLGRVRTGKRDQALPWFAETRRDEVVRPPTLQATD